MLSIFCSCFNILLKSNFLLKSKPWIVFLTFSSNKCFFILCLMEDGNTKEQVKLCIPLMFCFLCFVSYFKDNSNCGKQSVCFYKKECLNFASSVSSGMSQFSPLLKRRWWNHKIRTREQMLFDILCNSMFIEDKQTQRKTIGNSIEKVTEKC